MSCWARAGREEMGEMTSSLSTSAPIFANKGKRDKKDIDCTFYHMGTCTKGVNCEYRHRDNLNAEEKARLKERIEAYKQRSEAKGKGKERSQSPGNGKGGKGIVKLVR